MNILKNIHNESDLAQYMNTPGQISNASSFLDYFFSLPETTAVSRADLVQASGIERTYCYQILNGRRAPGRDKIISLCLAARLSLKKTQRALESAGMAPLYSRSRRDAILIYSVNHHLSTINTNELLDHFGEALLQ